MQEEWVPGLLVQRVLKARPTVTWCAWCDAPLATTSDEVVIAPWGEVFVRPGLVLPTADHLVPTSRGGGHGVENLVLACGSCNSSKGAKTAEEFHAYRLVTGWYERNGYFGAVAA